MIEPTTTEKEVDTVRIKTINCTRKYLDTLRKRTAPFKLIFHESITFVPHFFVNDCVSLVEVIFEGDRSDRNVGIRKMYLPYSCSF